MKEEIQVEQVNNKNRNLVLGLLFDGIGMLSFTVPFLGEFSDVVWAPLAGFLMTWMYKGAVGKVGGNYYFSGRNLSVFRFYTHVYVDLDLQLLDKKSGELIFIL